MDGRDGDVWGCRDGSWPVPGSVMQMFPGGVGARIDWRPCCEGLRGGLEESWM